MILPIARRRPKWEAGDILPGANMLEFLESRETVSSPFDSVHRHFFDSLLEGPEFSIERGPSSKVSRHLSIKGRSRFHLG